MSNWRGGWTLSTSLWLANCNLSKDCCVHTNLTPSKWRRACKKMSIEFWSLAHMCLSKYLLYVCVCVSSVFAEKVHVFCWAGGSWHYHKWSLFAVLEVRGLEGACSQSMPDTGFVLVLTFSVRVEWE